MKITKTIKIDLLRKEVKHLGAIAVCGDYNSRCICFELYEDGKPWEIPRNARFALAYRTDDGTKGSYDVLADDPAEDPFVENRVLVQLGQEVLRKPGTVELRLQLMDGDATDGEAFPVLMTVEPGFGELA